MDFNDEAKIKAISRKRKSVIVITPHPDDLEFFFGHETQFLISKGYQIFEIMMTWGEYGVRRFKKHGNILKGIPLRKIRKKENRKSKSEFGFFKDGTPHIVTIPMNFVDGHIKLSNNNIKKIKEIIILISPEIIFCPDPIYAVDSHSDHITSGYLLYYSIKLLEIKDHPKNLIFYGTFKPNFYFPIQSWDLRKKGLSHHKSQYSKIFITFLELIYAFYCLLFGKGKIPLRKIDLKIFQQKNVNIGQLKKIEHFILFYIFYQFSHHEEKYYFPKAEDLGLIN